MPGACVRASYDVMHLRQACRGGPHSARPRDQSVIMRIALKLWTGRRGNVVRPPPVLPQEKSMSIPSPAVPSYPEKQQAPVLDAAAKAEVERVSKDQPKP